MTIADRLQILINQEYKTNKNFSEKLEISPNTVTRWMKGTILSTEIILKLVELTPSLSVDWLLFGRGKMHINGENMTMASEKLYGYKSKSQIEETKDLLEIIKSQNNQISFLQDMLKRYQSSEIEGVNRK